MNDMTPTAGHNMPPDPIDEALVPYMDAIEEAENWLDGNPVEDEAAMKAVDALIADIRKAKSDLGKAKKSSTAPLHDAWRAEIARWKPTEDDIERRLKGLAAVVDPFKRKLAAEKEAAKRAAYEAAQRKEREAREAASAANKDTVKGLRTVTKHEITDHRAALHWIAQNDRDAITAFIEDYARRNHKTAQIEGVKVWQEKEAY